MCALPIERRLKLTAARFYGRRTVTNVAKTASRDRSRSREAPELFLTCLSIFQRSRHTAFWRRLVC